MKKSEKSTVGTGREMCVFSHYCDMKLYKEVLLYQIIKLAELDCFELIKIEVLNGHKNIV